MEIVRCSNGHFYDSEAYHTCPRCEAEKNGGVAKTAGFIATEAMNIGGHTPADNIMQTDYFRTQAERTNWQKTTDAKAEASKNYPKTTFSRDVEVSPIPKTTSVREGEEASSKAAESTRPVVGWLVCIQGPTKGKDYRIVDQNNYIGRNANMEISVPEDPSISAERSAIIAYDFHTRSFYFGLGSGHNMVSINDRIVFNPEKIKAYDVLGIGSSKFIFIPLCGEQFEWNE